MALEGTLGRGCCRVGAFLVLALLAACGGGGEGASSPKVTQNEGAPDASVSGELNELVGGTWMAAVVTDPDGLTALLDGPGGPGWLALFHRDLAGAEQVFAAASTDPQAASARLGLARTHLERGRILLEVAGLQTEAALRWARYRRDHADAVRPSPYGSLLAALAAVAAGAPAAEQKAFVDKALSETQLEGDGGTHKALQDLLQARRKGAVGAEVKGLGPLHAERLAYVEALGKAELGVLPELPPNLAQPDLVDPLGRDEEAGVVFEAPYFDPAFVGAQAHRHFLSAAAICGGQSGACGLITELARLGLPPGRLPVQASGDLLPSESQVQSPLWAALVFGSALDADDARYLYSAGSSGASWPARLAEAQPAVPWATAAASEEVDAVLRAEGDLTQVAKAELERRAKGEGASLIADLDLSRLLADRSLRSRMQTLCVQEGKPLGKRFLDRSLDPNPGSRGGPATAVRTRVSHRNDRVFLIQSAGCLAHIGQLGGALDLLHPLSEENPSFSGLEHYWAQLDAATTVGVLGKTSQL